MLAVLGFVTILLDQTKIIRTCFRWETGSDYLFSTENRLAFIKK